MSVSEIFFTELWNQLLTNQADSFLARVFRDEKKEAFSRATLDKLLGLLADRNKNLQLEARLETEYYEWLDRLRKNAPDVLPPDLAAGHPQRGRAQYRRLREALKNHPEAVSESELQKLRGIVQDAAAVQDAWNFLYNSGFGRKKKCEEDKTTGEKTVKVTTLDRILPDDKTRKIRKNDRMLRLLDEWCSETNHSLVWAGTAWEESRAEWKEMFRLLQGETGKRRDSLLLPVKIDPSTGIGLYLVGLKNFRNKKLVEQIRNKSRNGQTINYVFLCFGPTMFIDDTKEYEKEDFDFQLADGAYISLNPMMGEETYSVSLEDGEKRFSYLQKDYSFFRGNNGSPPPGTPKGLHIYFEQEEQEKMDLQALADEGRKASEEEISSLSE